MVLLTEVRKMIYRARKTVEREFRDLRTKSVESRLIHRPRDAYATHMPVLMGVARIVSPRKVLELGSGKFSTPAFLNRDCFPTITELVSVENMPEWSRQVRMLVGGDQRFTMVDVSSVPDYIEATDISGFDLIFVDDSGDIPTRTRTLKTVLRKASPTSVVVVHDFEVRSYHGSITSEWNQFAFKAWRPMTGVVSRRKLNLVPLHTALIANRSTEPSELQYWSRVVSSVTAS